jgi:hypothetical protein
MKKFSSTMIITFAFVASLFAGGCSSKKASSDKDAAADVSAMQATQVASNDANLGKVSSGRAR